MAQKAYEYEVKEPGSVFDVITGKESVKVEHQIAIPAKTIVLTGLFVVFVALVGRVFAK